MASQPRSQTENPPLLPAKQGASRCGVPLHPGCLRTTLQAGEHQPDRHLADRRGILCPRQTLRQTCRGESPRPGDEVLAEAASQSARALCRRCSPNLESASSRGRLRAVQVAARARESRSQPGPEPGRLFGSGMDPRQSPRSRLTAESPDRCRRRVYWTQPGDRHRVCQSGEGCPSQVV